MFKMAGQGPVLGYHRPPILFYYRFISPDIDHWLNCQAHPLSQRHATSGLPEIWNLGIFVDLAADAVAHILGNHAKPLALDVIMDRGRNIIKMIIHAHLLDTDNSGLFRYFE